MEGGRVRSPSQDSNRNISKHSNTIMKELWQRLSLAGFTVLAHNFMPILKLAYTYPDLGTSYVLVAISQIFLVGTIQYPTLG